MESLWHTSHLSQKFENYKILFKNEKCENAHEGKKTWKSPYQLNLKDASAVHSTTLRLI